MKTKEQINKELENDIRDQDKTPSSNLRVWSVMSLFGIAWIIGSIYTCNGCSKPIVCPDRNGCSYEAVNNSGDTITVYQIHYDGLNVFNIKEPVCINECNEIVDSGEEVVIVREAKDLRKEHE